jgi:hypothetical protein
MYLITLLILGDLYESYFSTLNATAVIIFISIHIWNQHQVHAEPLQGGLPEFCLQLPDIQRYLMEAQILEMSPGPSEVTASDMMWNQTLKPAGGPERRAQNAEESDRALDAKNWAGDLSPKSQHFCPGQCRICLCIAPHLL